MSRNSLTRYTAWHLRIRRLVQFIFVGAIYHNALTICAALLCRALRRVNRLCSRTVSGTANRLRKTRKKNSSAVPLFAAVTCRQAAPDPPRERGDSQEGGNRRCLPSCAPARRQRTPAEVQRKTHRPLGANRLRGSCAPDNRCRKRCCPDRAYCCATRVPSILCAGKEAQLLLLRKKSALFLAKERQK